MFANVDLIRPFYRDTRDFIRPYGLTFPLQPFAIICKRHMHEYGTTSRQLGAVAVACRKHASMNPRALLRTPLTIEDHQKSRMVMDPMRELDIFNMSDGGCAIVVTSAERAKDLSQRPVYVMAGAQTTGPLPQMSWELRLSNPDILDTTAEHMAQRLFGMAGITPEDVDVVQFYDCISSMVLLGLEGFGFCKKGESGPFVEGGRIELGGKLPVNTSGGHLAEGYVHGMSLIVEGVRQMRGTSSGQVKDAEITLVSGAMPVPTSAIILRR
jgi:acetyl-CoA acetyltransferase